MKDLGKEILKLFRKKSYKRGKNSNKKHKSNSDDKIVSSRGRSHNKSLFNLKRKSARFNTKNIDTTQKSNKSVSMGSFVISLDDNNNVKEYSDTGHPLVRNSDLVNLQERIRANDELTLDNKKSDKLVINETYMSPENDVSSITKKKTNKILKYKRLSSDTNLFLKNKTDNILKIKINPIRSSIEDNLHTSKLLKILKKASPNSPKEKRDSILINKRKRLIEKFKKKKECTELDKENTMRLLKKDLQFKGNIDSVLVVFNECILHLDKLNFINDSFLLRAKINEKSETSKYIKSKKDSKYELNTNQKVKNDMYESILKLESFCANKVLINKYYKVGVKLISEDKEKKIHIGIPDSGYNFDFDDLDYLKLKENQLQIFSVYESSSDLKKSLKDNDSFKPIYLDVAFLKLSKLKHFPEGPHFLYYLHKTNIKRDMLETKELILNVHKGLDIYSKYFDDSKVFSMQSSLEQCGLLLEAVIYNLTALEKQVRYETKRDYEQSVQVSYKNKL